MRMRDRRRQTCAAMDAWVAERVRRWPWVPMGWYAPRSPRHKPGRTRLIYSGYMSHYEQFRVAMNGGKV